MCEIITINSFLLQNYIYNPAREYVPLPHVFPPSAIRQSPTGRDTLGSRTLSGVASLCHSLRWCKKITAHPQLRTLVWCSALPSSSPLLLAFRHATSECLYKYATNKNKNPLKGADFVYIIISLSWNCS